MLARRSAGGATAEVFGRFDFWDEPLFTADPATSRNFLPCEIRDRAGRDDYRPPANSRLRRFGFARADFDSAVHDARFETRLRIGGWAFENAPVLE